MRWRGQIRNRRPQASRNTIEGSAGPDRNAQCRLDNNSYPKRVKVSDEELARTKIQPDECYREWNCTPLPKNRKS